MSLRSRLRLVALTYLAIFFIGAIAIVGSFRAWSSELDTRRDLMTASRLTAQLDAAYVDQQTSMRTFALVGAEDLLRPYEDGATRAANIIVRLGDVAHDNPTVQSALDDVVAAGETWTDDVAVPVISSRRDQGESAALGLLENGQDTELFTELQSRLDTLDTVVEARAQMVTARTDDRRELLAIIIGVKLATLLLFTALVAWLSQRWILSPLSAITTATRRVQGGENVPITVDGPPELATVAQAVDDMQRTIAQQRDTAVRARESIEQNALLALQMRTELASALGEYPPGWTVSATLRAAEGLVAGDSYDVSLLSPDEISVVVLDIAGHGAIAAMSAFKCKELIKAALRSGYEPGASLMWLTDQELGLGDSFFTAVVATVNTSTATCRYANAGHPPPVLSKSDGSTRLLEPTGPLFGLVEPGWTTAECTIELGESLTIYTDGLSEARDHGGVFYGERRIADVVAGPAECDADLIMKRLLEDLASFQPGRLRDDVTVAVVCHV